MDPEPIECNSEMFGEWDDRLTIFDSLILCRFYRDVYQWEELAIMIKAATGLELDREAMKKIARNITNDTRRFNIREGLTRADDKLPKRFFTEALPETGKVMTREQIEHLLTDYYRARGWDPEGRPAAE